jgi:hypothetical protein
MASKIDTSADAVERLAHHAHKLLMGTTLGDPVPATMRALAAERDALQLKADDALHRRDEKARGLADAAAERDALQVRLDTSAAVIVSQAHAIDAATAEAERLREALQRINEMRGGDQAVCAFDMRSIAKAALAKKETERE